MNHSADNSLSSRAGEPPQPSVPATRPIILEYRVGPIGPGPFLATVAEFSQMEAQMAKAKLESEGIPCCLLGGDLNAMNPLLFPDVVVQVPATDLTKAKEILSRPAADDTEDEYADENWRCPNCHCKALDLLPLPTPIRRVRKAFFILLLAPLAHHLLKIAIAPIALSDAFDSVSRVVIPVWLLLEAGLGVAWLAFRRRKRCRHCHYEWEHGAYSKPERLKTGRGSMSK